MKEKYLEIFLREWGLFKQQEPDATSHEADAENSGAFDDMVNQGDVRLFADADRPMVGLVYKPWGEDGWIVVPVSEFSVPATEQELLIGNRVYQLWNSFTAPQGFVERSWKVDVVSRQDLQDVSEGLIHVMTGDPLRKDLAECSGLKITSIEDPRLEYERSFATRIDFSRYAVEPSVSSSGSIFNLSKDFWRQTVYECLPAYRYAAATESEDPKSFMLLVENASAEEIRKRCVECSVVNEFRPIYPGHETYTLAFALTCSLPEQWNFSGKVGVKAVNRATLEVVGDGEYDPITKMVIIKTVQVKDLIDKPSQMVLVMAKEV